MNAGCYKIVFSKRLGALVAVGEHALGQGKAAGTGIRTGLTASQDQGFGGFGFVGLLKAGVATTAIALLSSGAAIAAGLATNALPTGAVVNTGKVAISTQAAAMTIQQTTDKASVNWNAFNIGSGASVNVQQNSANSVLLNRVVGNDPSQILGKLTANGQVVLVNPNGIVFGKDGSVAASAFTASTFGISEQDFANGKYNYTRNGSTAGVTVQTGATLSTTAPGGYVALIGASVDNQGTISTQGGTVVMAAGKDVALPTALTNNVSVPLSGKVRLELLPSTINSMVANSGTITTEGGQVLMQAAALSDAVASVTHTGVIDTSGVQGGAVTLQADNGDIRVSGSVKANSTGAGNTGGDIVIGRDADTGVLANTTDARSATLQSTNGFVETSAKYLDFGGVNVQAGNWLLDPYNITIGATEASSIQSTLNGASGANVTVSTTTGGYNGNVAGDGNITINANINKTTGGASTLSLYADNGITFNSGFKISGSSSGGALDVNLTAKGNAASGVNSYGINVQGSAAGVDTNGKLIIDSTSKYTGAWDAAKSALYMNSGNVMRGSDVDITLNVNPATQNRVYGLFAQNNTTIEAKAGNLKIASTLKNASGTTGSMQFGWSTGAAVTVKASGNVTLTSDTTDSSNQAGVWGINLTDTKLSAGGNVSIDSQLGDAAANAIASGFSSQGTSVVAAGTVTLTSNKGRIALGSLTSPMAGTAGLQGTGITINNGTGSAGAGIEGVGIAGGGNVKATTGDINITGTSAGGVGVNVTNTMTAAGLVKVTGASTAAFTGANTSAINAGSVEVTGTSASTAGATTGVITATGNVTITGTSGGGSAGANTGAITTTNGLVKVTGTSNSGAGVIVNAITGKDIAIVGNSTTGAVLGGSSVINATAGGVSITGTGNNGSGYAVTTGNTITATGDILISTTSAAKHGMTLGGAIKSTGGKVTIYADVLTGGSGSGMNGSATVNALGDIYITGKTNGYYAINGLGAIESAGGKVTIDATSTGSRALQLTNTVTAQGDVLLKGKGGSDNGVNIGALVKSTGGTVTVTGESTGGGRGVEVSGLTAGITAKSYEVKGTSASNYGIYFGGTATFNSTSTTTASLIEATKTTAGGDTIYNAGTLNLNSGSGKTSLQTSASSTQLGGGIRINGGSTVNTSGDVTIGSKNSSDAYTFNQGTINALTGNLTIKGQSAGNAVFLQDVGGTGSKIIGTNGANITIDGTSTGSGTGVNLSVNNSANTISTSTTTGGSAGLISITGVSATGNGIYQSATTTITNTSGAVTMTGTSSGGSGLGLYNIGGSITSSGALTLDGNSAGSNGVYASGAFSSTGASVTLTGKSSTSSALSLQGTINAYQDVTLKGTNTGASNANAAVYSKNAIAATNGKIDVTASSSGTTSNAVHLDVGANLSAKTEVNIKADTLSIATTGVTPATISAGTSGLVTIKTDSTDAKINIGAGDAGSTAPGARTLGLSNAELNRITAGNLVIGDASNTGGITVSAATTTNATTGNVTMQTGGNIAVNAALTVGDTAATKNLTLNGAGATSAISQTAFIRAAGLELLGANATHTLTNTGNDIKKLAGDTKTVSLTNNANFAIDTVNTVGLKTLGNTTLNSSATVTQTQAVNAAGLELLGTGGSYTLNNANNTIQKLAGSTGSVSLTNKGDLEIGTVNTNGLTATGNVSITTTVGSSTLGNLTLKQNVTGANVNLNAAGSVLRDGNATAAATSLLRIKAGGSIGTSTSRIKTDVATLSMESVGDQYVTEASAVTVAAKSTTGSVNIDATTGALTVGSSTLIDGSAIDGVSAATGVVLTAQAGDLNINQGISNTASGDVVLGAGVGSGAGDGLGGDVKTTAGKAVTTFTGGKTYIYTGAVATTRKLTDGFSSNLDSLYFSTIGSTGPNAASYTAYTGTPVPISGGQNTQVFFREAVDMGTNVNLGTNTLTKTYGDISQVYATDGSLTADLRNQIKTNNALTTIGRTGVTGAASNIYISASDLIDSLVLTKTYASTDFSTSSNLRANTSGYGYSMTKGSAYTVTLDSVSSAKVVINKRTLDSVAIAAAGNTYGDTVVTGAVSFGNTKGTGSTADKVTLTAQVVSDSAKDFSTSGNLKASSYTQKTSAAQLAGDDAGNYTLADTTTSTANYTVSKRTLDSVAIAATGNTYGDTVAAGAVTFGNTKGAGATADKVTLTAQVVSDSAKDFSTSGNLKANSYTQKTTATQLAGDDSANYTVVDTTTSTANYTVSKKGLIISNITASSKIYNGDAMAAVVTTGLVKGGLVGTDNVTVSATGKFRNDTNTADDKNVKLVGGVAAAKTVALNSSYGGADKDNYTITDQTVTNATITQKALTISGLTASDKTYNGDAVAAVVTTGLVKGGLVGTDDVTVSATGKFRNDTNTADDKNVKLVGGVAAAKTVALSSSYGGADKDNYAIADQATSSATITAKELTFAAVTDTKVYDGGTTSGQAATVTGKQTGDTITVSQKFGSKNVLGSNNSMLEVDAISINDGNNGNNYSIGAKTTAAGTITAKELTFAAVTDTKVYDGGTTSSKLATVTGTQTGDTITATQAFANKNVLGANNSTLKVGAVTISDGNNGNNYTIGNKTIAAGSIFKKSITLDGITAANKTYDGNATATVSVTNATFNNKVAGDDLSVTTSGTFSDKNVATGKTVSLINTLGGADLANYNVTTQASTTADISKKSITLDGITAANKTYDGNTTATVSVANATFNNKVAGDDLSVTTSGSFSDKNVATGKTVSLTNTLAGADLANYNVTTQASTTADISKKSITLDGITAANKTYDGNTTATITAGAIATGVANETLAVSGTGTFSDKNAANGKTVTVANIKTLVKANGTGDWDNYNLTSTGSITTTANIDKKSVTLDSITAPNKVYDGTDAAVITSGSISTGVNNETLGISGKGKFADSAPGTNKVVTVADVTTLTKTNGTGDWNNYKLNSTGSKTTKATITSVPPSPPAPSPSPASTSSGSAAPRVKIPLGSGNPFQLASVEMLVDEVCSASNLESCFCESSTVNQEVSICYEKKER